MTALPAPETTCPECGSALPEKGFAGLCPRCVANSLTDLWENVQMPPPGAPQSVRPILPGWEILEPLGAGGQGIVWHAVHLESGGQGALKVFHSDQAHLWENAARMEAEARALCAMTHPNIVRVLTSGQTPEGQFYIITEFVEGCDLQRLIQAQRLPVDRVLEITTQVAKALAHAHDSDIVHRDLKPANVLVGRDGSVKLADFSLAHEIQPKPEKLTVTQAGTVFGTPYYLAPEVMRGEAATEASDLYALGVMLYEMLTGAPPAGRFTRVSAKCDLPREVDAIIEQLLAEAPAKRPASAQHVLDLLDRLGAARAGAMAARLRRHRWTLTVAGAAILSLAVTVGYLIPRPVPAPPPPAPLNPRALSNPAAATRATPWKNSLGMAFIPVSGLDGLLVCKHETRMSDFLLSLEGEGPEWEAWKDVFGVESISRLRPSDLRPSGWEPQGKNAADGVAALRALNLPPDAPACSVNIFLARRFCAWLTWREQRRGHLSPNQHYRLPTDGEWSLFAGLPEETELSTEKRHLASKGSAVHPWGLGWPPPARFANYAGTEARDSNWPLAWLSLPGRNDDFPRAAPVGSFAESTTGLHDLWGNVWEWCESPSSVVSAEMTLRGGSWVDGGYKAQLRKDFRRFERANLRESCIGFRCVLVVPDLPGKKKNARE